MKQIKTFLSDDEKALDIMVNKFLKLHKIYDIKTCASRNNNISKITNIYTIIYENNGIDN